MEVSMELNPYHTATPVDLEGIYPEDTPFEFMDAAERHAAHGFDSAGAFAANIVLGSMFMETEVRADPKRVAKLRSYGPALGAQFVGREVNVSWLQSTPDPLDFAGLAAHQLDSDAAPAAAYAATAA